MEVSCNCLGMLAFFAPLLGMATNVLTQIVIAQVSGNVGRSIIAGALLGLAASIAIFTQSAPYTGGELTARAIIMLLTYASLAFCFWATLNLNITSLRIRMLREMLLRPNHEITPASLENEYKPGELVERRIARLLAGGQIAGDKETGYRTAHKGILMIAMTIEVMRTIVIPNEDDI